MTTSNELRITRLQPVEQLVLRVPEADPKARLRWLRWLQRDAVLWARAHLDADGTLLVEMVLHSARDSARALKRALAAARRSGAQLDAQTNLAWLRVEPGDQTLDETDPSGAMAAMADVLVLEGSCAWLAPLGQSDAAVLGCLRKVAGPRAPAEGEPR